MPRVGRPGGAGSPSGAQGGCGVWRRMHRVRREGKTEEGQEWVTESR